jgi:hypothetical protein
MRKTIMATALALASAPAALILAAPAFAQAQADRYSVTDTLVGKMIDDPAAAAVLKMHIPSIWANSMFQSAGRELTLKAIQQYKPSLTDEKLAEIQADLDALAAKD